MFNNDGYMTRGFSAEIPDEVKVVISELMVDVKKDKDADYLQVFNLKPNILHGVTVQEIIHTQEVPPKSNTVNVVLFMDDPVTEKIFVIDDNDHHTFMLASEY